MLPTAGAAQTAVSALADVPREPPHRDLGGRIFHGTDSDVRHAIRLLRHLACAASHRARQRHRPPNAGWVWRQLIQATAWNRGPRYLIRDCDSTYGGDFIPRARRIGIETHAVPHAPGKRNRGTAGPDAAPGVCGPRDPAERAASAATAARVCRLLQLDASAPNAGLRDAPRVRGRFTAKARSRRYPCSRGHVPDMRAAGAACSEPVKVCCARCWCDVAV